MRPRDLQPALHHSQHSFNPAPGSSCGSNGVHSTAPAKHGISDLPARYFAGPTEQSMQPTGMQPQHPQMYPMHPWAAASHQSWSVSPQQASETRWTATTNTTSVSPEQPQHFEEQLRPAAAETTGPAASQQVRAAQALQPHLHRGAASLPHDRLSLSLAANAALATWALCPAHHRSCYSAVVSPVECASTKPSHAAFARQ